MVADVRQRMSEGKLIDPPGDSARDLLANLRAAAPTRPEVEELSRALSTRLLDSGKQAMAAKAFDRSGQLIAAARDVGARFNEPASRRLKRDLTAARDANALQTNIVSAAALKRTRMVNAGVSGIGAQARRRRLGGARLHRDDERHGRGHRSA